MTTGEVETHLAQWFQNEQRVYKYRRWLMPTEYVVIRKKSENLFACEEGTSTYKLGEMDRETIGRMISNDELVFYDNFKFSTDCRKLKTGNCSCGAWATNNPNNHADHCELVKARWGKS